MNRVFRFVAVPVVMLACGFAFAQDKKAEEPKKDGKDIVAVAKENKLTTFVTLVQAADLEKTLTGAGPFTVFAPTDEAFLKFGALEALKKDKAKLADVLKAHVVAKKVDPKTDKSVKPVAGADITLEVKGDKVMVNGKIAVTKTYPASNGTIHVIDQVIGTPAMPEIKAPEKPAADKPAADKPKTPDKK